MSISLEETRHVAQLARLKLQEEELKAFQGELNALLDQFEDLMSIEVEGLTPHSHAVEMTDVTAADVPGETLPRDQALANSSLTRAGLFIVPTIREG